MAEEGILRNMRSLYDITEKLLKDKYMTAAVSLLKRSQEFKVVKTFLKSTGTGTTSTPDSSQRV